MKLLQGGKEDDSLHPSETHIQSLPAGCASHRREHLDALAEVADEGHDGHLLHEALDLTELHHEAVLIRQALQRLALLLELPQDLDLVLGGLKAHQTLHEVHWQRAQVEAARRGGYG